ncbi:MAG: hypothetical protein VKJ64_07375 [Leptolyngbyaceae bacterium]|nr:hypothetical protein [Leptolyngbyaceae bacterium]
MSLNNIDLSTLNVFIGAILGFVLSQGATMIRDLLTTRQRNQATRKALAMEVEYNLWLLSELQGQIFKILSGHHPEDEPLLMKEFRKEMQAFLHMMKETKKTQKVFLFESPITLSLMESSITEPSALSRFVDRIWDENKLGIKLEWGKPIAEFSSLPWQHQGFLSLLSTIPSALKLEEITGLQLFHGIIKHRAHKENNGILGASLDTKTYYITLATLVEELLDLGTTMSLHNALRRRFPRWINPQIFTKTASRVPRRHH